MSEVIINISFGGAVIGTPRELGAQLRSLIEDEGRLRRRIEYGRAVRDMQEQAVREGSVPPDLYESVKRLDPDGE